MSQKELVRDKHQDNVPRLRFPEFTDEWQKKKLGDFISSLDAGVSVNSEDGAAHSHQKGIMKTSCVTKGFFDYRENKAVTSSIEIKRLRKPIKRNTLVISRMNTPQLVGANALVSDDYPNLYLPDRLWAATINEMADAAWVAFKTGSKDFRITFSSLATGTSDSMKNITKDDVLGVEVIAPSLPEQQKIASFLTAVDQRITNQQQKLSLLKDYKKGVMQKIFTQQIRFKDENGEAYPGWEERRLREVAMVYQPVTISQSDLGKTGYPVYGANGIIGYYDQYNHESEQIAITCRGNTCGTINYTKPKAWITGNAMVVNTDDFGGILKLFLYYQLLSQNLGYLISGSGQPQITGDIKKHKIALPPMDEQQKIAELLTSIDDKIKTEENLLTSAKAWKKGLLQRMFV